MKVDAEVYTHATTGVDQICFSQLRPVLFVTVNYLMICLLNTCKLPDIIGWRDMLAELGRWRWFLHFYIVKLTIPLNSP